MSSDRDGDAARELDTDGPAAPPRANGELVFAAPWESRAFGLAMALHERGLFEWQAFRRELIAEIAAWDRAHPDGGNYVYYARWLAALERVVAAAGACETADLDERTRAFAVRPVGHDH